MSGAAYRYDDILAPLADLHGYNGDQEHAFDDIRSETEKVLDGKSVKLAEILATSRSDISKAVRGAAETKGDDGLLVKSARWLEERLRRWLP